MATIALSNSEDEENAENSGMCEIIVCMKIYQPLIRVISYHAGLIYLNFHPLEVVSCYRNPQLKVAEIFV